MTKQSFRHVFSALALLSLAACGTAQSPAPGTQVAMGRPTSDMPAVLSPRLVERTIPDEVLHDPAQRFALVERLRTQVVAETRQLPEARWRGEMRPALRRQLVRAGLPAADVEFLLWEIDQAKNARN